MSTETTTLDPPVHNPPNNMSGTAGGAIGERVQLYATIRRSSEYRYQHNGKVPFPVGFGTFGPHIILGNNNRYRIADLRFYVKVGDRFVALS